MQGKCLQVLEEACNAVNEVVDLLIPSLFLLNPHLSLPKPFEAALICTCQKADTILPQARPNMCAKGKKEVIPR